MNDIESKNERVDDNDKNIDIEKNSQFNNFLSNKEDKIKKKSKFCGCIPLFY